MLLPLVLLAAASFPLPESALTEAFDGRPGTIVLIDCASGETQRFNSKLAAKKLPPCSTFKIWSTAIGLETGALTSADQPFWKWDGAKREIASWNGDLTLREAYAASCVPAFQDLARRIGPKRMNEWIQKIGYGDENTSSGNDVFWLPAPGRKTLLISADEQAALLRRLTTGEIPLSAETQSILKDIMAVKTTARGTLYGKTGSSGTNVTPAIGWFVGYAVSGERTLAFACLLTGDKILGRDARTVVERLLAAQEML